MFWLIVAMVLFLVYAKAQGAEINVRDFGSKGDGKADDTAAIQAAIDAIGNNAPYGTRGGRLRIPGGEYLIGKTITLHRMSVIISGDGIGNATGGGSVLRWVGPADTPMFRITDSRGVVFEHLRFEGKASTAGTSAINFNALASAGHGTNEQLVVRDCYFGRYAWSTQGTNKGDLANGVLFDGANANNDQFAIERCAFSSCGTGVSIRNSQSIWGSVTDCVFDRCGTGTATAASVTLRNPQFNRCALDMNIPTGRVQITGWQSEHSQKLATVGVNAGLIATGGVCQLDDVTGPMIDAFPSGTNQTLTLRDMQFTGGKYPPIKFGPKQNGSSASGAGFAVTVDNCVGLRASQCSFAGSIWADKPETVGVVDWFSRSPDGVQRFRNLMRRQPEPARSLDTTRRDW